MEIYLKQLSSMKKVCEGLNNSKLFDLNSLANLIANYFTSKDIGLKMMIDSMIE